MKDTLAILGGSPVRENAFPSRKTMGEEEKEAVIDVMDSDCISAFLGSPGEGAWGGPKVLEFEKNWAEFFGYKHAISVNSWTAGLTISVGAVGLTPGDEIICPPYTMSASSTSAFFYGVVPVFADIDPKTFCLDPESVEKSITSKTKAIMIVHLFGGSANIDALYDIADRHNLRVIEDAAQAPGTTWKGKYVGGLKDIGGFSLNYHKHIHCGEGGVLVTNDDDLALRAKLIRNHGENFIDALELEDLTNIVGGNYRLTELQAAIGIEQLKRLNGILNSRRELVSHLEKQLESIPGISSAYVHEESEHAYYVYPLLFDKEVIGIERSQFIEAVNAELPPPTTPEDIALSGGYVKPLYLNKIYQEKIAIGCKGFPFNYHSDTSQNYAKGLCPTAEKMYEEELLLSSIIREPLTTQDIDDFINAIKKVINNAKFLK
ncbi:DegT/DnrJ/EryC1/StrS aminotransferase [gamma proteobacterium IMCC1989]|nr:DegT/DnrJ/EryC1/StrS aminotransferase [gamma proteobacterium IMCC1989]